MSKRARKGKAAASSGGQKPTWGNLERLSEVRVDWQPILYKEKINNNKDPYCYEKVMEKVHWQKWGVFEPFRTWGWLAALQPITMGYADDAKRHEVFPSKVLEWMSTLTKSEGDNFPHTFTLTGKVGDDYYTLSLNTFNDIAANKPGFQFDTGIVDVNGVTEYTYPTANQLFNVGASTPGWFDMVREIFVIRGTTAEEYKTMRVDLKPLPRLLSMMLNFNVLPRKSDKNAIRNWEIPILHAMTTGSRVYSLRMIMMLYIWDMRDTRKRSATVPFMRFLSTFLLKKGAIGHERPVTKPIKPYKREMKGMTFEKRGGWYYVEDWRTGKSFKTQAHASDSEEESADDYEDYEEDDDEMDVDYVPRQGLPEPDSGGERRSHGGQGAHSAMMRDGLRAQWYMQEYYRHQDWQYREDVRHYHDHIQDRPYVPEYERVDYSLLQRRSEMERPEDYVAPPYPGIPPPMYYQPPPPPQQSESGEGSSSRPYDPYDMAPLARSLYDGIFGPPPQ